MLVTDREDGASDVATAAVVETCSGGLPSRHGGAVSWVFNAGAAAFGATAACIAAWSELGPGSHGHGRWGATVLAGKACWQHAYRQGDVG